MCGPSRRQLRVLAVVGGRGARRGAGPRVRARGGRGAGALPRGGRARAAQAVRRLRRARRRPRARHRAGCAGTDIGITTPTLTGVEDDRREYG